MRMGAMRPESKTENSIAIRVTESSEYIVMRLGS